MSAPTASYDPSMQVRLRVDNDSQLARLLEGRTLAVLGRPLENLTVEAYEPSRRIKLHNQLVRSRKLRAIIEDAAARADALPDDSPTSHSQAIEILQSTVPHINELARLTEALRGNYVLEDEEYNEWNEWVAMKNEMEEDKFMRDQRILRRELREWGKETNPMFEMDEELEKRHDALICKPRYEPDQDGGEIDDSDERGLEEEHPSHRNNLTSVHERDDRRSMKKQARAKKHRRTSDTSKQTERGGRKMNEDVNNSTATKRVQEKTRSHANKQPIAAKASSLSKSKSDGNHNQKDDTYAISSKKHAAKRPSIDSKQSSKKKKARAERAALKDPPELLFQAQKSAPVKPAGRAPKRCHDCRETTARYRKCSYWHITGTKCGKFFCIDCLSSKYTLGDDVLSDSNPSGIPIDIIVQNSKLDSEWHCPSCLKTCTCAVCIKQRQREEDKEKSRDQGERRSSRRSTEQSDYSSFFQTNGGGVLFS